MAGMGNLIDNEPRARGGRGQPLHLADDLLPSPAAVRTALHGLRELFVLAVDRNVPVETWSD